MLYRLPNGDWLDPRAIQQIRVLDTTELTGGGYAAPRTVIVTRDGGVHVVERPSIEKACELADELARFHNTPVVPVRPKPEIP